MKLKINDLYDFVRFIINKTMNGALPPDKFNLLVNVASRGYFDQLTSGLNGYVPGGIYPKELFDTFQNHILLLQPFLKSGVEVVLTNGAGIYPESHGRTVKIYLDDAYETEVEWKRNYEVSKLLKSYIDVVDSTSPIYKETGAEGIAVYPKTIPKVKMDYYKYPEQAKWGFTQVGSKPKYDEATSTDLEWESNALIPITSRILASVGVNLKDNDLVQYSQLIKQQ